MGAEPPIYGLILTVFAYTLYGVLNLTYEEVDFKRGFCFLRLQVRHHNVRNDLLVGSKVASDASMVENFDLRAADSSLVSSKT